MPVSADVSAAKWELEGASAAKLRPLCEERGGRMGLESASVRIIGSWVLDRERPFSYTNGFDAHCHIESKRGRAGGALESIIPHLFEWL